MSDSRIIGNIGSQIVDLSDYKEVQEAMKQDSKIVYSNKKIDSFKEDIVKLDQRRIDLANLKYKKDEVEQKANALISNNLFNKKYIEFIGESATKAASFCNIVADEKAVIGSNAINLIITKIAKAAIWQSKLFTTSNESVTEGSTGTNSNMFQAGTFSIKKYNINSSLPEYITITLLEGDSLENIRNKINFYQKDTGLCANIVTLSNNNYRMIIKSNYTGVANSIFIMDGPNNMLLDGSNTGVVFRNTFTDGVDTDLDSSTYNHSITAAQDAQIIIDGITITRSSNRIDDFYPGIILNLLQNTAAGDELNFKINPDIQSIIEKISEFIESYNDFVKFLQQKQHTDKKGEIKFYATLANESALRTANMILSNRINYFIAKNQNLGITLSKPITASIEYYDQNGTKKTDIIQYCNLLELDTNKLLFLLKSNYQEVQYIYGYNFSSSLQDIINPLNKVFIKATLQNKDISTQEIDFEITADIEELAVINNKSIGYISKTTPIAAAPPITDPYVLSAGTFKINSHPITISPTDSLESLCTTINNSSYNTNVGACIEQQYDSNSSNTYYFLSLKPINESRDKNLKIEDRNNVLSSVFSPTLISNEITLDIFGNETQDLELILNNVNITIIGRTGRTIQNIVDDINSYTASTGVHAIYIDGNVLGTYRLILIATTLTSIELTNLSDENFVPNNFIMVQRPYNITQSYDTSKISQLNMNIDTINYKKLLKFYIINITNTSIIGKMIPDNSDDSPLKIEGLELLCTGSRNTKVASISIQQGFIPHILDCLGIFNPLFDPKINLIGDQIKSKNSAIIDIEKQKNQHLRTKTFDIQKSVEQIKLKTEMDKFIESINNNDKSRN